MEERREKRPRAPRLGEPSVRTVRSCTRRSAGYSIFLSHPVYPRVLALLLASVQ